MWAKIVTCCVLLAASALPAIAQQPTTAEAGPTTGPISGYMDFHFNKADKEDGKLDFHRFVVLMTHSFSPKIRFVGELELEHAFVEGLEEAGELELEQAYLDFLLHRKINIRAGMLLVPVGIINERHEPPVYHGVERPFVDTVIVPSTWFETGAGVHGILGRGFRYRAYLVAPLNSLEFNARDGVREGRQKGSESNVRNIAYTGRLEYLGLRGLTLAASFYTGESGFETRRLDTGVGLVEVDARYRRRRLELRGQFARIGLRGAGPLNDSVARLTGVSPNIAKTMRGFYGETAYRIWNSGSPRDMVAFVRYENFDTQLEMPAGFLPLKEFDRDAVTTGLTYFPDPDVAVKLDYTVLRNKSHLFPNRHFINVGLGWWF